MKNAFIFVGRPGSGKSTLSQLITGLHRISTGDIARRLADGDPILQHRLDNGVMFPESDMRSAFRNVLDSIGDTDIIIDGMPRFEDQRKWLECQGVKCYYIIVDTDAQTCVERMKCRGRDDDNNKSIAKRMAYYNKYTERMINAIMRNPESRYIIVKSADTKTVVRWINMIMRDGGKSNANNC